MSRHALDEMSRLLAESGTEGGRVLPIVLKYLRLTVLRKERIAGQRREITTSGHVMDRMVQRDILGAMDIVNQWNWQRTDHHGA